jgi:hypothetical protein
MPTTTAAAAVAALPQFVLLCYFFLLDRSGFDYAANMPNMKGEM